MITLFHCLFSQAYFHYPSYTFEKSILFPSKTKLFGILFFLFIGINAYSQNGKPNLVINEFLANSGFSKEATDWVEVYNAGEDTINMAGMYWTNDLKNPYNFPLSISYGKLTLIPPKQYKYFLFSKDVKESAVAVKLQLNEDGGQIGLYSATGVFLDTLNYGPQQLNVSCGRKTPNDPNLFYFYEPSPGKENSGYPYKERVKAPVVSLPDGYYEAPVKVSIEPEQKGDKICYTLDGSFPNPENCFEYLRPFNLDNSRVLKTAAYRNGHLASKIVTRTYLVHKKHEFPVFSLTAENWDRFYLSPDRDLTDTEILGHATFIDTSGQKIFSKYVGISLAGGASRQHQQKPISIHTRSEFGGKWMKYKMFPDKPLDKFRGFVLRNDGNAIPHTHFKDALLQNLVSDLGTQDYLSSRPVIVYINGKYQGIFNVREKKCKHYYEGNHGVEGDSLNILIGYELVEKQGSKDEFIALTEFINNNDLGVPENINYVQSQMDIENFLDYQICEIFYANTDWPINNVRIWKSQEKGSKWRWMLYDLDLSFREYKIELNSLEYALGNNNFHNERMTERLTEITSFLRKLTTDNVTVRNQFINRFADLLNTNFRKENLLKTINSFEDIYENEMVEHIEYWKDGEDDATPINMKQWESGINNMRSFAVARTAFMWQCILDQWDLKGVTPVSVQINDGAKGGQVQINRLKTNKTKWEGQYFQEVPLSVVALPNEGYKFSHWEINKDVEGFSKKRQILNLTFSNDKTVELKANFKKK